MDHLALVFTAAILALPWICLLWVSLRFLPAWRIARDFARKMSQSGELGPSPSDRKHAQMLRVAGFFARNFVGKVEVVNAEKLHKQPAPFVFALNHGSLFDVAIVPVVLKRKARFPAAQAVMQAFGGWVGYIFGRWGVYAVDTSNGRNALLASIKVLCSGGDANIVPIFPEGHTNSDGQVGPFKTGAVRMIAAASQELGKPVPVIPGYIRYGRYPGSWIMKHSFAVQWLLVFLGAWYWGRGATLVIGDPIYSSELPADPRLATEYLRQRVIALDPGSA